MNDVAELEHATTRVTDLGFRLDSPYPTGAGDSRLIVAIRDIPTLRHYDPEHVRFWTTSHEGRGMRLDLTAQSEVPEGGTFSWGIIELVDRLAIQNDFVTLGGEWSAGRTAPDTTTVVFISPGPILSLGGHSQEVDRVALDLGAFFGRIMVPIDFQPGVEQAISAASPLARYAAFAAYERDRFAHHPILREEHPHHAAIAIAEARRLEREEPFAWAAGGRLLATMDLPD